MAKKIVFVIIVVGLAIRIWFVPKFVVGDFVLYLDWGRAAWEAGLRNVYFGKILWEHAPPNYPPLSVLMFAGLDWLYEHKYVFALLHNAIRFPPSLFIVYFYEYGKLLLFKLPPILSDLILSVIVYKVIFRLTKNTKKAILGMALLFLNPITIFLSSAWGQTDSVVALFGILSFLLLAKRRISLAILLFFLGLNIKPSWGIFIPVFIFCILSLKPKLKELLLALGLVVVAFFVVYWPFAGSDIFPFTNFLIFHRLPLPFGLGGKASNSAFNFHTIFLKIDRDYFNAKILGLVPAYYFSRASLLITNYFAYVITKTKLDFYIKVSLAIFVVGLGYFLFSVGMLERYSFPILVPMIILAAYNFRILAYALIINLIFVLNIAWSFFRRGSDELDHLFTSYNFLIIKALSFLEVVLFFKMLGALKLRTGRKLVLQFKGGK